MKKKAIAITAFTVIICLFLFCITIFLLEDKDAPVIEIIDNDVIYRGNQNDTVLFTGVIATDQKDGDVTASVVIESIHELASGDKVSIIYAARDSKNNVAKKERILAYVKPDTIGETVSTEKSQEELEPNSNNEDVIVENNNTGLTIQDDSQVDETTENSDDEQVIDETQTNENGTEDINQEETGDTPLVSTGAPVIRLNTYEVTIATGEYFNPMNYIEDAVDDVDDAWRRIRIVGEYHTNTPGEYTLEYYVVDSDGYKSNVEILKLVVE